MNVILNDSHYFDIVYSIFFTYVNFSSVMDNLIASVREIHSFNPWKGRGKVSQWRDECSPKVSTPNLLIKKYNWVIECSKSICWKTHRRCFFSFSSKQKASCEVLTITVTPKVETLLALAARGGYGLSFNQTILPVHSFEKWEIKEFNYLMRTMTCEAWF